jgi:hypothetical protein
MKKISNQLVMPLVAVLGLAAEKVFAQDNPMTWYGTVDDIQSGAEGSGPVSTSRRLGPLLAIPAFLAVGLVAAGIVYYKRRKNGKNNAKKTA